jgi:antitoxin (DNA-binding transcriptional repressor) of toxin-antitoxin stability system
MLDAVENRGESFLVVRRGRPVARIAPASAGHGSAVKDLLRSARTDADWIDDLRRIRSSVEAEDRRWSG